MNTSRRRRWEMRLENVDNKNRRHVLAWLIVVFLAVPAGALGQQSSAAPVFKQEELDLVKGQMIGGFAVIAYPAQYGNSGVMTFIVNHEGKVFQKNLGKNTASIAAAMRVQSGLNMERGEGMTSSERVNVEGQVAKGK